MIKRLRLNVWSPLPPSPSGVADYVAETLPALSRHAEVRAVVTDPAAVEKGLRSRLTVVAAGKEEPADLDIYHLGNSPGHGYVYRACLRRPGVAFLHEWSLHHLVLSETVERGDAAAYLSAMRRAYGEAGSFVGRQVARALGGDVLPSLFPLNERVLERTLAAVALTGHVHARARRALRGRPALRLPHHVFLPQGSVLPRQEARTALGLPAEALVVCLPGLATAAKRPEVALRVLGRLRRKMPGLLLVVAGAADSHLPLARWAEETGMADVLRVTGRLSLDDFVRHLCAADVVLCLRFPTHGEISGALVRALGVGRPALVSAGTPAAEEFPEGVVAPIDPGPYEEAELSGVLERLLSDASLGTRMGALARAHAHRHHDLETTVKTLMGFLESLVVQKAALLSAVEAEGPEAEGLLGHLLGELRGAARELGLVALPGGVREAMGELAGERP